MHLNYVYTGFTVTAYRVKYFKPILKEIYRDTSIFFFISRCLSIPVFRVTQLRIDINNVNTYYYKNTT